EGCEFVQGILGKHFGCLVTAWTLSMYLEYKFDYTYKNGVSNITSWCCPFASFVGGTFSNGKFTRINSNTIRYQGDWTYDDLAGSTRYLQVNVSHSGHVSTIRSW